MYDLCVVGAGPAGYTAALRAAELGKKTLLIEKDRVGGVCLHCGCIPTKYYAQSAMLLEKMKKAQGFGISCESLQFDLSQCVSSKNNLVQKIHTSLESFIQSKHIEIMKGHASFNAQAQIVAEGKTIDARFILIATGSLDQPFPGYAFDGSIILSSQQILQRQMLPQRICIVGGGVIGCEFASFLSVWGKEVMLIEKETQLLPREDRESASRVERILKKLRVHIFTKTAVEKIQIKDQKAELVLKDHEPMSTDLVLVAIGRKPACEELGLEKAGIATSRGWISTDAFMKTNKEHIYAAGDCTGVYFYAHSASHGARIAVENMFSQEKKAVSKIVPRCIFMHPQVACVGVSEEEAKNTGAKIEVVKVPFQMLGIAQVVGEPEGLLKLIIDREARQIRGVCIIGDEVADLISFFTLVIENQITIDRIKDLIFVHPTRSELIGEALTLASRVL